MRAKKLAIAAAMAMMTATAVPAYAQEALPGDDNRAVSHDRTLDFELAVQGKPPAGAAFSAVAPGANTTNLTDPDGDGVYTGSLFARAGSYPGCVPIEVFGQNSPGEASYEIRNESRFCFEDGDVFEASYSFDASGSGTTGDTTGGSPSAGSGQYAPGALEGSSDGGGSAEAEQEEEAAFAGVGVVENLGDGYGLRLGASEGVRLDGNFDFAAFEGEEVRVSGRFAIDETRARFLRVESIEPAAGESEDCTLTTYLEQPCPPQEKAGVPVDATMLQEAGTDVVSGDTSNADAQGASAPANTGGASASASEGGAAAAKELATTSGPAGGVASSAAKVLPSTGGLALPIAGAAGALLLAGGLLFRRIFR